MLGAHPICLWLHGGRRVERRQIEYVLAVIDHGGFTTAATALHISQPALSQAIKTLESELGATLFHRLSRGVRLTAAGEEFADSARRIAREMDTARARVGAVAGLVAGRLDLVALPGLLLDPLAAVIGRFRVEHPRVRVRLAPAETPAGIRDAVRSGAAELGLTDDVESTDRDLAGELIIEQELVAVLPPGSPPPPGGRIPLRELLGMDLVTGPVGTVVRDFLAGEAARSGQEFSPVVEVGLRGSALYLAMAGAGTAVLPRPLAELGSPHGVLLVPLDPPQQRHAYLMHRAAPLSPAARALRDLLL
ncbi:MAG: LysR family transcriptional regulator [Pseudonocardiaceae bacterium]|nr:LysR family transcriptional regulator [Pseudonocardiaceae bacterium]